MDKEIMDILNSINNKIDQQNVILNQHTEILNQHTEILNEHGQILRALEHASEVHSSELDRINHSVARLEGEVKGIREDLNAVEFMTSKNWNDIAKLKAVK